MADLVQVLRKTSLTVTETFQQAGGPVDIDSGLPTLAIAKPDGSGYTPLPTVSGSWTGRTTGQYRFVLPRQLECTWLDYELTGNVGGEPQTLGGRVEWVGPLLFTLSAMRDLNVAGSTPFAATAVPLFSDQQLMDARAAVLDEFEQILGFSPVPRFARSTVDGDGLWSVVLPHLKCHRLLSVTVNGVAQPVGSYTLRPSGILEATSGYVASGTFTAGRSNVAVEYVHGWERVMGDGANVAMVVAAMRLDPGISSTASSMTTPDGVSYTFDAAGQVTRAGTTRHYGVPKVDSWLQRWSQAGLAVA